MQCSGSQKIYSSEKVSEVQQNQYRHLLKTKGFMTSVFYLHHK